MAAAGGWKNELTLKTAYQQADAETMLLVVMGGGELREAKRSRLDVQANAHTPFRAGMKEASEMAQQKDE